MATKTIRVDYIARVEGEGALDLVIKDGRATSAKLKIFEPPRLFEALLRGRGFAEAPDITARICGICPVAYQMSSVHAMEQALGITVGGQLRELRRLLYCGEWIESHALHVVMLHAPDFLGFQDGIQMAAKHGDAVRSGLALKKIGNELMRAIGGREIHPVNVRVGGFYRVPRRMEFAPVAEQLQHARDLAVATVRWVATFPFPDYRARLRVRLAAPSRRVSDQRRPRRLEPRSRHRGGRLRQRIRGTSRCALDGVAIGAETARQLSGWSAGTLQPEFRPAAGRCSGAGP